MAILYGKRARRIAKHVGKNFHDIFFGAIVLIMDARYLWAGLAIFGLLAIFAAQALMAIEE